jgi:hypothetical protein
MGKHIRWSQKEKGTSGSCLHQSHGSDPLHNTSLQSSLPQHPPHPRRQHTPQTKDLMLGQLTSVHEVTSRCPHTHHPKLPVLGNPMSQQPKGLASRPSGPYLGGQWRRYVLCRGGAETQRWGKQAVVWGTRWMGKIGCPGLVARDWEGRWEG